VKRYPIDAAHVKAAWSYINMPKNQKGYSASQLAAIKGRIKAAMKKAGHDVSDDDKKSYSTTDAEQLGAAISHVEAVRKFGGGVTLVAVMNDGSRTPLPSFRQSGEYTSSPASGWVALSAGGGGGGGTLRAAVCPGGGMCPGDTCPDHGQDVELSHRDASTGVYGGPLVDETWDPPDNLVTEDPHEGGYGKSTGGGSTGTAPEPSADTGTALRGKGGEDGDDKDEDEDDDKRASSQPPQKIDMIPDEDDDEGVRSIGERLQELRGDAELPDLPTIDDAFRYLRQLA
jgi:hypothetical protein